MLPVRAPGCSSSLPLYHGGAARRNIQVWRRKERRDYARAVSCITVLPCHRAAAQNMLVCARAPMGCVGQDRKRKICKCFFFLVRPLVHNLCIRTNYARVQIMGVNTVACSNFQRPNAFTRSTFSQLESPSCSGVGVVCSSRILEDPGSPRQIYSIFFSAQPLNAVYRSILNFFPISYSLNNRPFCALCKPGTPHF